MRHVTFAVGTDRNHMVRGKAAGGKEQAAIEYHRGNELLRGAFHVPNAFAGRRIEAGHAEASGENQLVFPFDVPDQWRAVASRLVPPGSPPNFGAGEFVQRHEIGFAIMVAIEDHGIGQDAEQSARIGRRHQSIETTCRLDTLQRARASSREHR